MTLANALPRLESIDISVLRSSQLLRRVLAVGAAPLSSLQRKIVQLQGGARPPTCQRDLATL